MLYHYVEANGHDIVRSFDQRASCYKKYRARLDKVIDFGWWVWVECTLTCRSALLFGARVGLAFWRQRKTAAFFCSGPTLSGHCEHSLLSSS
jgi:hypothetical protein